MYERNSIKIIFLDLIIIFLLNINIVYIGETGALSLIIILHL